MKNNEGAAGIVIMIFLLMFLIAGIFAPTWVAVCFGLLSLLVIVGFVSTK